MTTKKNEKANSLEGSLNQSEALFLKYKKAIIISICVIVAVIVGYSLYHNYVAIPNEQEASTELAKGQEYMAQGQFNKALKGDGATWKGFLNVASDYSSTDAGNLANLYAGLCYAHLQKADWKKALEYAKKFNPSNDMIISPASQMALGDIYANNGMLDEAVEAFKSAASLADKQATDNTNNSVSPLSLKKAGIILESQNKKDEANKLYKEIKSKYINAATYQDIDKYIERTTK